MDVVPAARTRLLSSPGFADLLGNDVGQDDTYGEWIFEGMDAQGLPYADIEKSSTSALTLMLRSSSMVSRSSMRFRQLVVLIFSDDTQDDAFNYRRHDARARCERVADEVMDALRQVGDRGAWWGSAFVWCELNADLSVIDIPSMDGPVRGQLIFDVAVA